MSLSINESGLFFLSSLLCSILCYLFFGELGVVFGVITVLNTKVIYDAGNKKDFFLSWVLSLSILMGLFLGYQLKISIFFFIYLYIVSFFYYYFYNLNPHIDSAMPFFIIFSCLGTALPAFTYDISLSYILGATISIVFIMFEKKDGIKRTPIRLFSTFTYPGVENIFLRSMVYSLFLFLTLLLTCEMDLYRAYWAPLTFAVLLRPKENEILKITIYRFLGSLLGAMLIIIVFNTLKILGSSFYYIVLLLSVIALPTLLKMNYTVKSFGITIFVLLLLEQTEYIKDHSYIMPLSRVYETFIGGVMAILASVILKKLRID